MEVEQRLLAARRRAKDAYDRHVPQLTARERRGLQVEVGRFDRFDVYGYEADGEEAGSGAAGGCRHAEFEPSIAVGRTV